MDEDTEDANIRTKWSEDRTIMANERTFSSWMGAGMGSIGVAIGLQAVFGKIEPTWPAKLAASLFLVIAVVIFRAARNQACRTYERLTEHDAEAAPTRAFSWVSGLLIGGALTVGAILWSL